MQPPCGSASCSLSQSYWSRPVAKQSVHHPACLDGALDYARLSCCCMCPRNVCLRPNSYCSWYSWGLPLCLLLLIARGAIVHELGTCMLGRTGCSSRLYNMWFECSEQVHAHFRICMHIYCGFPAFVHHMTSKSKAPQSLCTFLRAHSSAAYRYGVDHCVTGWIGAGQSLLV